MEYKKAKRVLGKSERYIALLEETLFMLLDRWCGRKAEALGDIVSVDERFSQLFVKTNRN